MRRLFWLALGASLGVLIFRRLSRAAERMTPQGIAAGLGAGLSDLGAALRDFAGDVREAMSSQEAALRAAAGLDSGSQTALSPAALAGPGGAVAPGPAGDVAAAVSPTADKPAAGA
ncbi:MAG TPA: hypothetical protein VGX49_02825 [Jatrophihabitans sp.]|jgi:hypothetical protein|nr:hypothetical protein [Jatrophihabitans sp.]